MVRYPPDVLDCAYFPTADVIEDLTGRALGVTPPAPKPVAFSVLGDYFTAANADRLWVIGERLRVFARSMRALTAISASMDHNAPREHAWCAAVSSVRLCKTLVAREGRPAAWYTRRITAYSGPHGASVEDRCEYGPTARSAENGGP